MALIRCPHCGEEVSNLAEVCPACQHNLSDAKDNGARCKECGGTIPDGQDTCPNCGCPVSYYQSYLKQSKRQRNITAAAIAGVAAAALAVGLIAHSAVQSRAQNMTSGNAQSVTANANEMGVSDPTEDELLGSDDLSADEYDKSDTGDNPSSEEALEAEQTGENESGSGETEENGVEQDDIANTDEIPSDSTAQGHDAALTGQPQTQIYTETTVTETVVTETTTETPAATSDNSDSNQDASDGNQQASEEGAHLTGLIGYMYKSEFSDEWLYEGLFKIENKGSSPLFLEDADYCFRDQDDNLLQTESNAISWCPDVIQAGESLYIYNQWSIDLNDNVVENKENISVTPQISIKRAEKIPASYAVEQAYFDTRDGEPIVGGELVNPSNEEIGILYINVLYYGDAGECIGVGGVNVIDIPANGSKAFEISGTRLPHNLNPSDIKSYEFVTQQSYYLN